MEFHFLLGSPWMSMVMIFLFVELSGEYARNTSAAHNLNFLKIHYQIVTPLERVWRSEEFKEHSVAMVICA